MRTYLAGYAKAFGLIACFRPACHVTSVARANDAWAVTWRDDGTLQKEVFPFVIVASGVFSAPHVPGIDGLQSYRGTMLHSGAYREGIAFQGKRVIVVGASFSGIEIAADLAASGANVTLLFRRPVQLLPRSSRSGRRMIPLDLAPYAGPGEPTDAAAPIHNQDPAETLAQNEGHGGDMHPNLRVIVDGRSSLVAISDDFPGHVRAGRITPRRVTDFRLEPAAAVLPDGTRIEAEAIVFCTGFSCDLSFLEPALLQAIAYEKEDRFVPFLADKAVLHPDLANLAFVGVYRGPYFVVMELQARWAAMVFSGATSAPARPRALAAVADEERIRRQSPQPQFPHGDHVQFGEALAAEIGVLPGETTDPDICKMFDRGPRLPAHYRLLGPHARPDVAAATIQEVWKKLGL